ncbi:cytochrome c oxidase assembly protein subunit 15 [Flavobacterium micromati]|uniref:Cytochrome c oxidase assembly protein subunit 15 n=1 Tax=Flavobacterium micromati TaxID=229205 RepID=A0A1M5PQR6_9FLAO|nr:COX15/CtaA family protein [Flavobacterium micromati]SHH04078.1 cytochrome c oxidase assembly protein subunit 15 [Flavobacterium micromati]
MQKYFLKSAKISLILVYLVIFAGAFVRLTGSGMGCPDWPKCFGYYIPPTQQKELLFTAEREYDKGQVIIKDEALLVAKTDFVSKVNFDANNWEKYTKHDYAIFNPWHTWVEFINRLLGALAGVACIITFILAFGYRKENKKLIILTFLVCILMGFQAWLGKTVVDSDLSPYKITTHMLVALLIVAFQLIVIYAVQRNNKTLLFNKKFNAFLIFSLVLTLIQIILGTDVREQVDIVAKTGAPEILWLKNPTVLFYIHRSFSMIVFLTNLYLFYLNNKLKLGFSKMKWVMILIIIEIISGISMYYFDFPFGTQTIHLVVAALLFGVQFYSILESKSSKVIL